jgi:hypothetical protein
LPDVVEQLDPHPSGGPASLPSCDAFRTHLVAAVVYDVCHSAFSDPAAHPQRPRSANLACLNVGTAIHHGELSQKAQALSASDHYAATPAQTEVGDPTVTE